MLEIKATQSTVQNPGESAAPDPDLPIASPLSVHDPTSLQATAPSDVRELGFVSPFHLASSNTTGPPSFYHEDR